MTDQQKNAEEYEDDWTPTPDYDRLRALVIVDGVEVERCYGGLRKGDIFRTLTPDGDFIHPMGGYVDLTADEMNDGMLGRVYAICDEDAVRHPYGGTGYGVEILWGSLNDMLRRRSLDHAAEFVRNLH
jgi:hypothetical protein